MIKDNKNIEKPLITLSLGGGGAKTFAHLGVIDALKEADIPIDYLVTCSAASVIGLISALNVSSKDIIKLFTHKKKWWWFINRSIFKPALQHYIKEKNITDIKQANTPISIVTVDLKTSKEIIFEEGDPLLIPLGSSAFPGVSKPVKYKEYYLVDGGVLNPDPADIARQKVGSQGIVISVTLRLELPEEKPGNRLNTVLKALYVSPFKYRDKIIKKNSDIIITPLEDFRVTFSNWKETFLGYFINNKINKYYQEGYRAGQEAIPQIKQLIIDRSKFEYNKHE